MKGGDSDSDDEEAMQATAAGHRGIVYGIVVVEDTYLQSWILAEY